MRAIRPFSLPRLRLLRPASLGYPLRHLGGVSSMPAVAAVLEPEVLDAVAVVGGGGFALGRNRRGHIGGIDSPAE